MGHPRHSGCLPGGGGLERGAIVGSARFLGGDRLEVPGRFPHTALTSGAQTVDPTVGAFLEERGKTV